MSKNFFQMPRMPPTKPKVIDQIQERAKQTQEVIGHLKSANKALTELPWPFNLATASVFITLAGIEARFEPGERIAPPMDLEEFVKTGDDRNPKGVER